MRSGLLPDRATRRVVWTEERGAAHRRPARRRKMARPAPCGAGTLGRAMDPDGRGPGVVVRNCAALGLADRPYQLSRTGNGSVRPRRSAGRRRGWHGRTPLRDDSSTRFQEQCREDTRPWHNARDEGNAADPEPLYTSVGPHGRNLTEMHGSQRSIPICRFYDEIRIWAGVMASMRWRKGELDGSTKR
jgi:hypothetical protein